MLSEEIREHNSDSTWIKFFNPKNRKIVTLLAETVFEPVFFDALKISISISFGIFFVLLAKIVSSLLPNFPATQISRFSD